MSCAIEEFTRTLVPDFKNLNKEEIDANHFEMLKEGAPTVSQKAVLVGWSILWKSPRRPQYFSAMLRELTKRAKAKYAQSERPVNVTFHIYRSLRDQQHNMAVAHIDWLDTEKEGLDAVKEVFEWAPIRVRSGYDNDESRRYIAGKTATAQEFVLCIQSIGRLLDGFTATILQNDANYGRTPWGKELTLALECADRAWNEMPQAPTELALVEKFISNYLTALEENRWMRDPDSNITQAQREKWYPDNMGALTGYYLAWQLLLKTAGWTV